MSEQSDLFVLDNTLRYMYTTIRNSRANLVAIEFFHRGKKWKADTAEEAIRLRQLLETEDIREQGGPDETLEELVGFWTPEVFATFFQTIGQQQRQAVMLMAEHDGISSADLTKRLKLDSEISLAGVISGLSKQLRSMHLEPDNLYTVKTQWKGKKKERFFFLRNTFRQTAEEVGWPEEKGKDAASTKTKRK